MGVLFIALRILMEEPGPADSVALSGSAGLRYGVRWLVFTMFTDTSSWAATSVLDSVLARHRSTVRSRSVSGSMNARRAWAFGGPAPGRGSGALPLSTSTPPRRRAVPHDHNDDGLHTSHRPHRWAR